jgi:hypothetical protein
VLDIYATSVDYKPDVELSQRFFATVQNNMHRATHGHTAAEIIHARADATKPFMGLQRPRPGGIVRKEDAAIEKNYFVATPISPPRGCTTTSPAWRSATAGSSTTSIVANLIGRFPTRLGSELGGRGPDPYGLVFAGRRAWAGTE